MVLEKMVSQWTVRVFLGLVLVLEVQCQGGPPQVKGSYKASGEMVETVEDMNGLLLQIAFDESYNADTKDAIFRIWESGMNITYAENYQTNQTFKYTVEGCELQSIEEWVQTKSPPQLLNYEDSNGTVRFSLKQLFSLSDKFLQERNLSSEFRGMPARKWMYKMKGIESVNSTRVTIDVYAYWSDSSFNTTAYEGTPVPLGYVITKMQYRKYDNHVLVHRQFVNVFSFIPDIVDEKLFEPVPGVICPGRVHPKKFPDMRKQQPLKFHTEFLLPEFQEVRYLDVYLDPFSPIIRMDYERSKDDDDMGDDSERRTNFRKYQTEIAINKYEIVYRINNIAGERTCEVVPFDKYEYDIQNLVSFKLPLLYWTIFKIFGLNETSYVYLGETLRRDMPCDLYQGVRKDWPDPEAGVTSLWEYCISSNMFRTENTAFFNKKEYDLIDAQIKILESKQPGDFPPGLKMYHHFYDVQNVDLYHMYMTKFDISPCFTEQEKRELQFEVDWKITDDNVHLVENATSDVTFLAKWKGEIQNYAGIEVESLRIFQVRSDIINRRLYIKFTILAPHKDLPKKVKDKQKSSFDAEQALRKEINAGTIYIGYEPDHFTSTSLRLQPVKHSLQFQVNRTSFEFHTVEPLPEPTTSMKSSRPIFTLPPDVDETSTDSSTTASKKTFPPGHSSTKPTEPSTTPWTDKPNKRDQKQNKKHKAGTVVAVAFSMLFIGISIGSTGIFIKYKGLRKCCKCV